MTRDSSQSNLEEIFNAVFETNLQKPACLQVLEECRDKRMAVLTDLKYTVDAIITMERNILNCIIRLDRFYCKVNNSKPVIFVLHYTLIAKSVSFSKKLLPLAISPLNPIKEYDLGLCLNKIPISKLTTGSYTIQGVINSEIRLHTSNGKKFLFFDLFDGSGIIKIIIFDQSLIKRYINLEKNDKLLLIDCKVKEPYKNLEKAYYKFEIIINESTGLFYSSEFQFYQFDSEFLLLKDAKHVFSCDAIIISVNESELLLMDSSQVLPLFLGPLYNTSELYTGLPVRIRNIIYFNKQARATQCTIITTDFKNKPLFDLISNMNLKCITKLLLNSFSFKSILEMIRTKFSIYSICTITSFKLDQQFTCGNRKCYAKILIDDYGRSYCESCDIRTTPVSSYRAKVTLSDETASISTIFGYSLMQQLLKQKDLNVDSIESTLLFSKIFCKIAPYNNLRRLKFTYYVSFVYIIDVVGESEFYLEKWLKI